MRIGMAHEMTFDSPEAWIACMRELGVGTSACPLPVGSSSEALRAYREAARRHHLTIGEVGVWKNPISPDDKERREALRYAKECLAFADALGAGCCTNIAGAVGEVWDGYYEANYAADTYAMIVDSVRDIIDSVKPRHTFYSLEPMPWMHPDAPDDYLRLMRDIDRKQFAVHLDFANMINSLERYRKRDAFIAECFQKLGPFIKSVHAKDVRLEPRLPCVITEQRPGLGEVDFVQVLRLAADLPADVPLYTEHLQTLEEYRQSLAYLYGLVERHDIPVTRMKDAG